MYSPESNLFLFCFFNAETENDSANVFKSLMPLNSDDVMIHLGGYNCSVCSLWEKNYTIINDID